MIAHLKQRGVYTVFNTNAALLTRRRQVELIDSGLDELRVSLDSSTPETYLKVRGIPGFERVVDQPRRDGAHPTRAGRADAPHLDLDDRPAREPGRAARRDRPGRAAGRRRGVPAAPGVLGRGPGHQRPEHLFDPGASWPGRSRRHHRRGRTARGAARRELPRRRRAESPRQHARARTPSTSRGARAVGRCGWRTSPPRAPRCRAASRRSPTRRSRACGWATTCTTAWPRSGTGEAYQRFREQLYSSEPPASCRNCGLAWSL